jgi:very-short-patch-repair endonuclease
VLDQVDARSESPIETLLRLALRRRGIDIVDLQFSPDPRYRVDFLLAGKLVVEADGAEFHDPEKDRIRDAFLATLGYRVLRFTYDEIVYDIESVLVRIEAALRTR